MAEAVPFPKLMGPVIDLTLNDSDDGNSTVSTRLHQPRLKTPLLRPQIQKEDHSTRRSNHEQDLPGQLVGQQTQSQHLALLQPRSIDGRSGEDHTRPQETSRSDVQAVENPAKRRRINPGAEKHLRKRTFDSMLTAGPFLVSESRSTGKARAKDEELLSSALHNHVFPHIKEFLQPYRQSMNKETRAHIGREVGRQLCKGDFSQHAKANHGSLSPEFENYLTIKCKFLVEHFAVKVLAAQKHLECIGESASEAPTSYQTVQATYLPHPASSSEDDALPNSSASQLAGNDTRRSFSSSPTTSFSANGTRRVSEEYEKVTESFFTAAQRSIQNPNSGVVPPETLPQIKYGQAKVTPNNSLTLKPPSSFDLYRRDKLEKFLPHVPDVAEADYPLSIAKSWANENAVTKAFYKHQARAEKRRLVEGYSAQRLSRNSKLVPDPIQEDTSSLPVSIPAVQDSSSENVPTRKGRPRKHVPFASVPLPRQAPLRQKPVADASTTTRREVKQLRLAGLSSLTLRPYLSKKVRDDIQRGLNIANARLPLLVYRLGHAAVHGHVFHVDFDADELYQLNVALNRVLGVYYQPDFQPDIAIMLTNLECVMAPYASRIPQIVDYALEKRLLPQRSKADLTAFLRDIGTETVSKQPPQILYVGPNLEETPKASRAANDIGALLRYRETGGRCRVGIRNRIASHVEDMMTRKAEWTDLSGDIVTIAWMSGDRFLCGAITHSDSHNQQYNKPGNLVVGSVSKKSLKSMAGHRIPRPIIDTGDNSLASMRETQDAWLYSSVPSTAFDSVSKKCFTASYDKTVKVWDVPSDGSSMELCGTWTHEGVVNFVVTSPHHGRVATAADVARGAVRVYDMNAKDIAGSSYRTYSGDRADDQRCHGRDEWAYYPATIQWGLAASAQSLLLVGYSPRSYDVHSGAIPDEKLNTGELCLWNTENGNRIPVTSARMANVFEVIWHPTQPIFLAATSASGDYDDGVRTQIRLFGQKKEGTFSHMRTLDCSASDINEITIMPNSSRECYVTAGCTDGKTYVWDTAQGDKHIHVLSHGKSIDDAALGKNPEEADVGVKFIAWGRSYDRLYTGSSDGVVKAWNIRAPRGQAFVRDVIRLSGPVSAGAFSPDWTKLILGDATGKVHLLTVDSEVEPGETEHNITRKPVTPHTETFLNNSLEANDMDIDNEVTGREIAQAYLDRGQLVIHTDEEIGAVQGEYYASTGLFCPPEQHDPRWAQYREERLRDISLPRIHEVISSSVSNHIQNLNRDSKPTFLDVRTWDELKAEGVDFGFKDDNTFNFEPETHLMGEEVEGWYTGDVQSMGDSMTSSTIRCFLDNTEIKFFQHLRREIDMELRLRRQLARMSLYPL